jgi:hypothetical protein
VGFFYFSGGAFAVLAPGIVYPDGHPWSVDDVKALLGAEGFASAPLFTVEYFKDVNFADMAKKSITPMVDFARQGGSITG